MNIYRALFLLVMLGMLVACFSDSLKNTSRVTIPAPTLTNTVEVIATPTIGVSPTPAVTIAPPPTIITAPTPATPSIVSTTPACPQPSADEPHPQIGLVGIVPGVTTEAELLQQLGQPTHVQSQDAVFTDYSYYEVPITSERSIFVKFTTKRDTVDSINLSAWAVPLEVKEPNIGATVGDVIDAFGCPDFVYLKTLGMHLMAGEPYNSGELLYLRKGARFLFYGLPPALDAPIEATNLFVPIAEEEYVRKYQNGSNQAIVTWEEARTGQYEQPR